jgi:hypothetical protein
MGTSSLKWVKGHNGQRRKLARAVAHLEKCSNHDIVNYYALYGWWHRKYEPIANVFMSQRLYGAELVDRAWEILWELGVSQDIDDWSFAQDSL